MNILGILFCFFPPLFLIFYFLIWPKIRWRFMESVGLGKQVLLFSHEGEAYLSFEYSLLKGVVYVYPAERVGIVTLLKEGKTGGSIFFEGQYNLLLKWFPGESFYITRWEYVRP